MAPRSVTEPKPPSLWTLVTEAVALQTWAVLVWSLFEDPIAIFPGAMFALAFLYSGECQVLVNTRQRVSWSHAFLTFFTWPRENKAHMRYVCLALCAWSMVLAYLFT